MTQIFPTFILIENNYLIIMNFLEKFEFPVKSQNVMFTFLVDRQNLDYNQHSFQHFLLIVMLKINNF